MDGADFPREILEHPVAMEKNKMPLPRSGLTQSPVCTSSVTVGRISGTTVRLGHAVRVGHVRLKVEK